MDCIFVHAFIRFAPGTSDSLLARAGVDRLWEKTPPRVACSCSSNRSATAASWRRRQEGSLFAPSARPSGGLCRCSISEPAGMSGQIRLSDTCSCIQNYIQRLKDSDQFYIFSFPFMYLRHLKYFLGSYSSIILYLIWRSEGLPREVRKQRKLPVSQIPPCQFALELWGSAACPLGVPQKPAWAQLSKVEVWRQAAGIWGVCPAWLFFVSIHT